METPTDENRLGDLIEDIPELLNVMGKPSHYIEPPQHLEPESDPVKLRALEVCDDYRRLLRIIQLLLATRRLDREDVAEVVDVEEHLF